MDYTCSGVHMVHIHNTTYNNSRFRNYYKGSLPRKSPAKMPFTLSALHYPSVPLSFTDSPQEVGLLCLTEAADPDVRQQLLLQDVLGILDPVLASHTRLCPTNTDEVESNVLFLDHKGLVQRRLQLQTKESLTGVYRFSPSVYCSSTQCYGSAMAASVSLSPLLSGVSLTASIISMSWKS